MVDAGGSAAVASTVYLVRTALDYVVVYRASPIRDDIRGWKARGQIHVFEPLVARCLGVLPDLVVDEPRACRLSTAVRGGPWVFVRRRDVVQLSVSARRYWWQWLWRYQQRFCVLFLSAAGVPDLPIDCPLFFNFVETDEGPLVNRPRLTPLVETLIFGGEPPSR